MLMIAIELSMFYAARTLYSRVSITQVAGHQTGCRTRRLVMNCEKLYGALLASGQARQARLHLGRLPLR